MGSSSDSIDEQITSSFWGPIVMVAAMLQGLCEAMLGIGTPSPSPLCSELGIAGPVHLLPLFHACPYLPRG
jgi:hypothetical protein